MFQALDLLSLQLIARAGGGSSGGGHSSSGSSFHSSGTSISTGGNGENHPEIVLALLCGFGAFFIMLIVTSYIVKKFPSINKTKTLISCAQIPLIMAVLLIFSGNFINALAIVIGSAIAIYLSNAGVLAKSRKVTEGLQAAAAKDKVWDEATLVPRLNDIFIKYQNDWSNFNYQSIQTYSTEQFYRRSVLLMRALSDLGRRDIITEVKIVQSVISQINDSDYNSLDTVEITFQAQARDQLVDTQTNTTLFQDNSAFVEKWSFVRKDNEWLLNEIKPAIKSDFMPYGYQNLSTFVEQNNFSYSDDMGWLLIPRYGQLFSTASFGTSALRAHTIGLYHDVLVQIYAYSPLYKPYEYQRDFFVAQTVLPRNYGQIVVKPKGLFNSIRGLDKVETEWPEFNKKYTVFATKPELATSFELLNPTFMEKLEALNLGVRIEVYGNNLYMYSDSMQQMPIEKVYENLMQVIAMAFEELKM